LNASAQPAYARSWYTDTMVPAPARARLTADLDIEVCVVGGGLAGLTAAREIARRGWPVALIEARRIAWNASGRNTGFVLPGFAQPMDVVAHRVGLPQAKALWALSEAGLDYVRTTINDTGMPGVEVGEGGWLKVSKSGELEDDLAEVRLLGQEFGAAVEGWPVERVRAALKSRHYFHGVHFPQAFQIHPLNYALGLAAAAEAAGARIFEETPAISIDPDGVRKRVVTPSGLVRASHIVLAGNVHLGAVMPKVSGTLVPIWTYVITTAPLGARLDEAISYRGTVSDSERADNHYRIVGGDRLMWSGGMTTWPADPGRYVGRLQADIARVYPQLGEVAVEHIWSGVLGNALHRMPQIGELSPQVWLASGFGGHGLNTTAMAGNIIARAIVENDDTWRRFLPFELIWAGGRAGRAAAQVNYWWYHARELRKARQAVDRENARATVQEPTFQQPDGAASPRAPEAQATVVAPPNAASLELVMRLRAVSTFVARAFAGPVPRERHPSPIWSAGADSSRDDWSIAAKPNGAPALPEEPQAASVVLPTAAEQFDAAPTEHAETAVAAPSRAPFVYDEPTPAMAADERPDGGASAHPLEQSEVPFNQDEVVASTGRAGPPPPLERSDEPTRPTRQTDAEAAFASPIANPMEATPPPATAVEPTCPPAISIEAAPKPSIPIEADPAARIVAEPAIPLDPKDPPSPFDRAFAALSQFEQVVTHVREPNPPSPAPADPPDEPAKTGKAVKKRGRPKRLPRATFTAPGDKS
jgi:gamma-glutamylputrescine oxidase